MNNDKISSSNEKVLAIFSGGEPSKDINGVSPIIVGGTSGGGLLDSNKESGQGD